jgi:hypothetical protein
MSESNPTLYCANHPQTETLLRCNRCEKPICSRCAILTPTGYRCKECVRGQQQVFDTANWVDYPLALGVALVLSGIASWLCSFIGFLTILAAPTAGMIIAAAVRMVVRKRRSKRLFQWVGVSVALGALPLLLLSLLSGSLFAVVWQGIYIAMVAPTVYYRLWGIHVR